MDHTNEFENLLDKKMIETEGLIISMIQNHNLTRLLGILKVSDTMCHVKAWDINTA